MALKEQLMAFRRRYARFTKSEYFWKAAKSFSRTMRGGETSPQVHRSKAKTFDRARFLVTKYQLKSSKGENFLGS